MTHDVCTDAEWLIAKNVLVFLDSLEGLICMGSDDGGNHKQTSVLQALELLVLSTSVVIRTRASLESEHGFLGGWDCLTFKFNILAVLLGLLLFFD